MGSSSGKFSKKEGGEKKDTYPLKFNTNSPTNSNILIIYNDITALYADKIIKSLDALPTVNDYTIILHNVITKKEYALSRFTKHEYVYDKNRQEQSNNQTTNSNGSSNNDADKNAKKSAQTNTETKSTAADSPNTNNNSNNMPDTDKNKKDENSPKTPGNEDGKSLPPPKTNDKKTSDTLNTSIVEGVVTIYSNVWEDYEKDALPPTLKLKFSASDTALIPRLLVQVTDKESNDVYYDGRISSDWSKLYLPPDYPTTYLSTTKLFLEDEKSYSLLRFERARYQVDSAYSESFKYLVLYGGRRWYNLDPHFRTVATRNGVYCIYKNTSRSKYLMAAIERFAAYYTQLTNKKFTIHPNFLLFNNDSLSGEKATFNGVTVNIGAKSATEFDNGVDVNFFEGNLYPRSLAVGFQYNTPFIAKASDKVCQLFEKADYRLSGSSYFDYYHGTIQLNASGKSEAFVLGAILNLKTNPDKKFTFYVDPTITDANTLEYIKNHKFLLYESGYLTNIPNFGHGENIFKDDGSSYMTVGVNVDGVGENDLALNRSKLISLRDNLKPITNPFFATFIKSNVQGYFIESPKLILPPLVTISTNIYVLTAKSVSLGALWNFARLTTRFYKTSDNPSLNINNWVYVFKSKAKIPNVSGINSMELDQGYHIVYPKALLTWKGSKIAIKRENNGLSIDINGALRYIFFNDIPQNIDTYPEAVVINESKESPGKLWSQDASSGIWKYIKPSYNLITIAEPILGGPINPLIVAIAIDVVQEPTMLNIPRLKDSNMLSINVLRNLKESLIVAYIKLFETFFTKNNETLYTCVFFGIDLNKFSDAVKSMLSFGKFYQDDERKVVVIYYVPKTMKFQNSTKELTAPNFGKFVFNDKQACATSISNIDEDGAIYCEDFVNSADVKNTNECIYAGLTTATYMYNRVNVTYSDKAFLIETRPLKMLYSLRYDVRGEVRGVPNYIRCTAMELRYSEFWALIRRMNEEKILDKRKDFGDYMLLVRPSEINSRFRFPALEYLTSKYLESKKPDVKTTTNNYLIVSSAPTIVVGHKITVLNVEMDITNNRRGSSSDVVYDTTVNQWFTENPGFSFSTVGWGISQTFKQLNVQDPRANVTVDTIMSDITPVISFMVLRNPAVSEITYLNNLYKQFDNLKHLLIIVISDRDVNVNLDGVTSIDRVLIMYNSTVLSVARDKYLLDDGKSTYIYMRVESNETDTYMKFGVALEEYSATDRASILGNLDFVINYKIGSDYGSGGLKIDSNDRTTPIDNLYSFRSIDAQQAPIFNKFVRENNKYINFLHPLPTNAFDYPTESGKYVVVVKIMSQSPFTVFEPVTVLRQVQLHSKDVLGFYVFSYERIIIPNPPKSFSISDVVYSSTDLYGITSRIFTLPLLKDNQIRKPYYYLNDKVPLQYDPKRSAGVVPAGADGVIYAGANGFSIVNFPVAKTVTFTLSKITYTLSYIKAS